MDTISTLYKKEVYLNKSSFNIFNGEIIEYDMADAGFNLIKEYNLLSDTTIEKLSKQGKRDRTFSIGKIRGKNKEFSKELTQKFQDARKLFFEANELEDQDILSIKKDAIITLRPCTNQKFGTFINFREKNNYTSYIYTGKLEIYYVPKVDGSYVVDVKGINDDIIKYHNDYLLAFIARYFYNVENHDRAEAIKYINRFITDYKFRKLDVGYYRTFDSNSIFMEETTDVIFSDYDNADKSKLDIRYNYFYLLIPMCKLLIK